MMPTRQNRNTRKLERQAFGLTILDPGHPAVRQLRQQEAPPSLHGHKIWRASFVLLDYLHRHSLKAGTRVLELGCGWGLVGLYCAKRFNAEVTALDADAAVFPYLQLHARLNGVHIETRELAFADFPLDALATYDLMVGADICFWDELITPLYHLVSHAMTQGVAEILVADPDRPPFDELCARCAATYNTEVFDWEVQQPVTASGRILRMVSNAGGVCPREAAP